MSKIVSVVELVTKNMPEVTRKEEGSALNAWNALAVWKIQTTVGTSVGLPSLDIAFYKGATPHKMRGISIECAVLMGSTLEINLLLLDS